MNTIKEKGDNILLNNLVIHRLNKIAGEKTAKLILAQNPLDNDIANRKFIANIRDSYTKKAVPTHGIFEDQIKYNGFQQALNGFVTESKDFMQFTIDSMEYYKKIIETSTPATGSFLIFAEYKLKENAERYILIVAIDNKENYNLSETALKIKEIKSLDLNKMDLASVINLSRWEKYKSNDSSIKTYLTFVKGKKKISDYFMNFIGCQDKTTAAESSTLLLNTLQEYFALNSINDEIARHLKSNILDYCTECNKNKREILLSQISFIINNENAEDFLLFATAEDKGMSEVIKYDSKILRTLKYIEYSNKDFSLKFNKEKYLGKDIKISKDKSTITITNIPDELKIQF